MRPDSSSAKAQMIEIIRDLPDDASYDEILRELAFHRMVRRGLDASDRGRTVSTAELRQRIKTWQP